MLYSFDFSQYKHNQQTFFAEKQLSFQPDFNNIFKLFSTTIIKQQTLSYGLGIAIITHFCWTPSTMKQSRSTSNNNQVTMFKQEDCSKKKHYAMLSTVCFSNFDENPYKETQKKFIEFYFIICVQTCDIFVLNLDIKKRFPTFHPKT